MTYHRRKQLWGFLFVLPTLLFFAVFSVYPMLKAFQVSVHQWDLVSPMEFVGLKNYAGLLQSKNFRQALGVTWTYIALVYPVSWALGFSLAVLLNERFLGRDFFRTAFFLPTVFPIIGMSLAWWVMYQPNGLINNLIGSQISWMTRSKYAMPGLAIMDTWRGMGYWMVLFLVGLQSIPKEFYDAAKVDGAGAWQQLRFITVPLMKPVFSLIVVISLIWGMQVMVPMFVMTQGGPGNSTRSIVMLIYQTGIRDWRMGVASAMSVALFFIMLILTVLQLRLFRVQEEK
jgi:ABC-type sugar transport system permease subunit